MATSGASSLERVQSRVSRRPQGLVKDTDPSADLPFASAVLVRTRVVGRIVALPEDAWQEQLVSDEGETSASLP